MNKIFKRLVASSFGIQAFLSPVSTFAQDTVIVQPELTAENVGSGENESDITSNLDYSDSNQEEGAEKEEEAGPTTLSPFKDIKEDDWFAREVHSIYEKGIMTGTSEKEFSPDSNLDRAQFVTILYRINGSPEVEVIQAFPDTSTEAFYSRALVWAQNNQIVNGHADGYFRPSDPISREDFVLMLSRYESFLGHNINAVSFLNEYSDGASVDDYAKRAVAWANTNNLLTGVNGEAIAPLVKVNRAQCAVILDRYMKMTPVAASEVSTNEQKADFYTMQVIEHVRTDLKDLYDWTVQHISFTPDIFTRSDAEYAVLGYENQVANCQAYSSVFNYLAQKLGYQSRTCFGKVYYSDGSSDAHGFVLIMNPEGTKEYLYDPAEEDILGHLTSFWNVDPNRPPMRYSYPLGEEPLGGYLSFEDE